MPTILYSSTPIVFLRSKKTGSTTVKKCIRDYAISNQISFLEVHSKDIETVYTNKFVSHMPAKYMQERCDVWDLAYKFSFCRNPWDSIKSYYYFCKYTGPKYGWNNPENYRLSNVYDFVSSMIDIKGTCNFNNEIYAIDDKVVADVFDMNQIASTMKRLFDVDTVPKLNTQDYKLENIVLPTSVDNYIYRDYKWEIEKFEYERPMDNT